MSLIELTCPSCGAYYFVGVVGTTFIGGHVCPKAPSYIASDKHRAMDATSLVILREGETPSEHAHAQH